MRLSGCVLSSYGVALSCGVYSVSALVLVCWTAVGSVGSGSPSVR